MRFRTYDGRVRLCPYYFVTGNDAVRLGGVLATIAPADKRLIHGMTDAVMTSCVPARRPRIANESLETRLAPSVRSPAISTLAREHSLEHAERAAVRNDQQVRSILDAFDERRQAQRYVSEALATGRPERDRFLRLRAEFPASDDARSIRGSSLPAARNRFRVTRRRFRREPPAQRLRAFARSATPD